MKKHLTLKIQGVVQGVGFRPHVFNMAKEFDLTGYILNDARGVTIEAEKDEGALITFKSHLLANPPRLADIQDYQWKITDNLEGYDDFVIKKSKPGGEKTVLISPDVAVCKDCLREMNDPQDRRYRYPFINCTNCGPRFTIITDVPYDRPSTSMKGFPMCDFCRSQYEDPANRRFHAQPVACPVCGPRVFLKDSQGREVVKDPDECITKAAELLKQGNIVAIKGLGGFHLAVDATNEDAVKTLRKRKYREDKPFAVMAPDVEAIEKHCFVNDDERNLLNSFKAPIVILKKKSNTGLAPPVAPNNNFLGVMPAYTPLHSLLLSEFNGILVMTSGNVSEEPIAYIDEEAKQRLGGIADYFLTNNRPVYMRCDDSVTRVINGGEYPLRRSRGYVPFPIVTRHSANVPILAVGGHLKNTFCLYRGNHAFVSHHIGDLENTATMKSFTEGIEHFKLLFDIEPQAIAHDMHPRYLSTEYALKSAIEPKIAVQHHHAHVASIMADNGIDGEVIGVLMDGVGYGADGTLWGCEFMRADLESFDRMAHLKYLPLAGGEKAIKEPWRMALAYLLEVYGDAVMELDLRLFDEVDLKKIKFIKSMIRKKVGTYPISSAGRLFDAVSAIIGIRQACNFEGQAAIEMEMLSDENAHGFYDYHVDESKVPAVVIPDNIITSVVNDLKKGESPALIGGRFHNTMAKMAVDGAKLVAGKTALDRVVLGGGVFQNIILLKKSIKMLKDEGFKVYIHKKVPTNDGGISLGQAAIAAAGIT